MCQFLEGVLNFPPSLKSIGDSAFNKCKTVEKIEKWPESLVTVGEFAFAYTTKLGDLPRFQQATKLESVGASCFIKCVGMKSVPVPLPKTVTFGDYCFSECQPMNKAELDKRLIIGTRRASSAVLTPKDLEDLKCTAKPVNSEKEE